MITCAFLPTLADYDDAYTLAANGAAIWPTFGQEQSGDLALDRTHVEGYVSYFPVEDQAWVRAECWATIAYARGYSEQRPSTWGLNELPILTVCGQ